MRTPLSIENTDLVKKVISDAKLKQIVEIGKENELGTTFPPHPEKMDAYQAEKQEYWGKFTPEQLDILQGVYYAGRNFLGKEERDPDDIESVIKDSNINEKHGDGKELTNWNITGCHASAIDTFLSKGLEYFNGK